MDQSNESAEDSGVPPIVVEGDAPAGDTAPDDLQAKLRAAEAKEKENHDKYLRAMADLENFRRRTKRDLEDAKAEARAKVLKEILPVVDNLERALEHAEKSSGDSHAILEGVRLVMRQVTQAFDRIEVAAIDASGAYFDPNIHEAISQTESDQPVGTIVSVLQKGYRVGERLLRPALVVVAKPRTSDANAQEDSSDAESAGRARDEDSGDQGTDAGAVAAAAGEVTESPDRPSSRTIPTDEEST